MKEDQIKKYGMRVAEAVIEEVCKHAADAWLWVDGDLQAIVDGVPTPRELSRARAADAVKTVMNKITIPTADVKERLAMLGDAIAGHPIDFIPGWHAAPPVPRDVLMAALGDCRAECAKHYLADADESEINLAAIADRHSRQLQPNLYTDKTVIVEVSGLTGVGKSGVAGEIEIAMKAIGLDVEWINGDEEKYLTHSDFIGALEMYRPKVVIVERNIPRAALVEKHNGSN